MENRNGHGPETRYQLPNLSESIGPSTGQAVRDYFSTDEIFQRVAASAHEEFERSTRLLLFGGLAAGLSIGLSFYARAAITAQTDSNLIGNLLYPIGFLLIVIGRYQLFTENTLTPVTLVLTRIASLPLLLRNWGVVLIANMLGAGILAFFFAYTPVLNADAYAAAVAIGEHALEEDWGTLYVKGIMAGWLVASMVWLVHAARDTMSRIVLVLFIMYLVPSADLYHCIIGICEALFMFYIGEATLTHALFGFFLPVLLGNTTGGVLLVAILNYAQTQNSRFPERDCDMLELTWHEWLLEFHAGRPDFLELPPDVQRAGRTLAVPVHEGDHVLGPDTAQVTVVQYGDYECPDSRDIYFLTRALCESTDLNIRQVFRHLPLGQHHPHAVIAARAAEAASKQGRFWDMHDLLFTHQDHLSQADLVRYAGELGLDIDRFRKDMQAQTTRDRIEADRLEAIDNKIFTSRHLFINGERYLGTFEPDALRDALASYTLVPERI